MKPSGWHSVTARIVTPDVAGLVAFIQNVFAATGALELARPTVLQLGDAQLMVSAVDVRQSFPAFLYVYVDDVDATHRLAIAAGATELEPPQATPYGDRRSMVKDAWNNVWQIAS